MPIPPIVPKQTRFLPYKPDEKRSSQMTKAFIFPGQGSQDVGMGKALADQFASARAVFEEVDDALGEKLTQIMWDGPKDTLTLTQNAQPALMAHSLAVVSVLSEEFGIHLANKASFVAGHSLGEYSALAAAGTFSISDTARLLRARGNAMQEAVPVGQGAMAALLGVGLEVAQKVADEAAQGDVCQVANDNDPAQVVLSGSKVAVDRVPEISKAHGARRAVPLPVSAPFHCSLMQPAADVMAQELSNVDMQPPAVPLIANVTAGPLTDPADIRNSLVAQVTGTVRWRECVLAMKDAGVTEFYELGSGKVLTGLVGRIAKGTPAASIGAPGDIDAAIDRLRA